MDKASASNSIRSFALAQVGAAYIMGATGNRCTPGYRRARAAQYPDYADNIIKACPVLSGQASSCAGCRDENDPAFDCAQLTLHAAEAAGLFLPSGATSKWNKGDWLVKGAISQLPHDHVCFLYRRKTGSSAVMAHTGIYLGDGTVVDARSHDNGVVHQPLEAYPWTHFAILSGMPCPPELCHSAERPVLKRGCKGDTVRELQQLLLSLGYDLKPDGIFGAETLKQVKACQGSAGLKQDGIVGPLTWAALETACSKTIHYTVTITGLHETTARKLIALHGGIMTEEGGNAHE